MKSFYEILSEDFSLNKIGVLKTDHVGVLDCVKQTFFFRNLQYEHRISVQAISMNTCSVNHTGQFFAFSIFERKNVIYLSETSHLLYKAKQTFQNNGDEQV